MTEPLRAVDPRVGVDHPASPGSPDSVADAPESTTRPPLWRALAAYAMICAATGAVAGVFWNAIVDLPSYLVHDDGSATISERSITEVFSVNAYYSLIGVVVGLLLGWLAWKSFHRLGWPVALVAALGSLIAAIACWRVGEAIGPGEFAERVSAALPGESVPIAFELTSPSALFVWMMAGLAPVLLWSSLGREDDGQPEPGSLSADGEDVRGAVAP